MTSDEQFQEIKEKLESIDKRLFMDNGGECLQSRINRIDLWVENHKSEGQAKVTFLYWLFPLLLTIAILVIDLIFRYG